MSNPDWTTGMASWNKTTECEQWYVVIVVLLNILKHIQVTTYKHVLRFNIIRTEDWRPCDFPYTGLAGYHPAAEHCYETFAESIPDEFVYRIGQIIYSVMYIPFILIFLHRVLYMIVDLKMLSFAVPFCAANIHFTRKKRIINIHDQCNILALLGTVLQFVRFYDLHAWQGMMRFTVYKLLGRLVRSVIVTIASIIIKIWMNLISFWTSKTQHW
jgi:hypothetical protein